MLLIHLNKKIDSLSESLTETHTMLKSLEDSNIKIRFHSEERYKKMSKKMNKIIGVLNKETKESRYTGVVNP